MTTPLHTVTNSHGTFADTDMCELTLTLLSLLLIQSNWGRNFLKQQTNFLVIHFIVEAVKTQFSFSYKTLKKNHCRLIVCLISRLKIFETNKTSPQVPQENQ